MARDSIEKASRDWGIIQKKLKDGTYAWYARIIRHDSNGRKRQFTAKADNKSHARRLRDELQAKFNDRGERAIEGDKIRFIELADLYETRKLFAAQYHGEGRAKRKVAGLRSVATS